MPSTRAIGSHLLFGALVSVATPTRAAADPAPNAATEPTVAAEPERRPQALWPWLAPAAQVVTIAGSAGVALANGMDPGRYALDTGGAAVGSAIGLGAVYLLFKYGRGESDILRDIIAIPTIMAAVTMGGLALGEGIGGHDSPLPARTIWPAFGGFMVGAVIDLVAIGITQPSSAPNDAAAGTAVVLLPFTIGATTVAGYSTKR